MRVATNTVSNNLIYQIQQLSTQQAKLQTEVATGQRIAEPEDDPAAVGRVLNLESQQRQLTQYTANASHALSVAQTSYSGLTSIKAVSDRAGELATLGTGVLGADASQGYADETNQLIEQALQQANSKSGANYIFGGTATATPPFTATRDSSGNITAVTYVGNSGQANVPLSATSSVNPNTTGTTNAAIGTFINNLIALRTALTANDTTAVAATQAGLTTGEDALVSAIANNGGVQTRIEAAQSEATDRQTNLSSLISDDASADMPSTIVKLNQTQTSYQAALQSSASIMKTSLLDYLQ